MTTAKNSGLWRETLRNASGPVRVGEVVRETLRTSVPPPVRSSLIVREVLRSGTTGTTYIREGQVVRETLLSGTVLSDGSICILW